VRPRGALNSEVQTAYIVELLCPQINNIAFSPRKLSNIQQLEIIENKGKKSLRELAREYGISYESVRRTISKASNF